MRLCGLAACLCLVAGHARADRLPAQIPHRSMFNRIFHRTLADQVTKQARRVGGAQARQLLLGYVGDRTHLSRTSIPELKKLLKAAPDTATRNTVYRSYVKHWTPSLAGNVANLMNLSGPGTNANQDYLVLRYARQRFFHKGASSANLEQGREDFMWLVQSASPTQRPKRTVSTRDFLLGRYARMLNTDLGHAKSEFRAYQSEQAAKQAAEKARREADDAQLTTNVNIAITAINQMNQMNQMNQNWGR